MNRTELNKIIDTLVVAPQDTVLIDSISLSNNMLDIELIHSDESGTIETEVLRITDEGTIETEGKFQTASDLSVLPLAIREVLARFIVALRDGEVHGDHPELELITANRQFFLDNGEAFVPAGVLWAAGIVDEHNMAID